MRRFLSFVLIATILAGVGFAGGRKGGYVHGYYKKNGTYVDGYYRGGSSSYSSPSLPSIPKYTSPNSTYNYWSPPTSTYGKTKKSPYSSWSSPTVTPKSTYEIGGTRYIYGETYKNGRPKVERSSSAKEEFLRIQGLDKIPYGYEIDHKQPLHWGGTDTPSNMQLLTKEQHRAKTARERSIDADANQWRK